jgi:hypothetical protein
VYLLGLYLGDGSIATHPRSYKLRLSLDSAYPGIIHEAAEAMQAGCSGEQHQYVRAAWVRRGVFVFESMAVSFRNTGRGRSIFGRSRSPNGRNGTCKEHRICCFADSSTPMGVGS